MVTKSPYMSDSEHDSWVSNNLTVSYCGFTIKPKRDFGTGFWDSKHRCMIQAGWVVTAHGCNPVPGGLWAHNLEGASNLIDCMIASGYRAGEDFKSMVKLEGDPDMFHALVRISKYKAA